LAGIVISSVYVTVSPSVTTVGDALFVTVVSGACSVTVSSST
jgi:hypothetical protein